MNKTLLLRSLLAFGQFSLPAPARPRVDRCWHCGNPVQPTCCRRMREQTEHNQALAARKAAPALA